MILRGCMSYDYHDLTQRNMTKNETKEIINSIIAMIDRRLFSEKELKKITTTINNKFFDANKILEEKALEKQDYNQKVFHYLIRKIDQYRIIILLWIKYLEKEKIKYAKERLRRIDKEEDDEKRLHNIALFDNQKRTNETLLKEQKQKEIEQTIKKLEKLYFDYNILFKQREKVREKISENRTNMENAAAAISSTIIGKANKIVVNGIRPHENQSPEQIEMFSHDFGDFIVEFARKEAELESSLNGKQEGSSNLTLFGRHKDLESFKQVKTEKFKFIANKNNLILLAENASDAEVPNFIESYIHAFGMKENFEIIRINAKSENKGLKQETKMTTQLNKIEKEIDRGENFLHENGVKSFSFAIRTERHEEKSKKIDSTADEKVTEVVVEKTEVVAKKTSVDAKETEVVAEKDATEDFLEGLKNDTEVEFGPNVITDVEDEISLEDLPDFDHDTSFIGSDKPADIESLSDQKNISPSPKSP